MPAMAVCALALVALAARGQTLDFNPGFVTKLAGDTAFTNPPSPPTYNEDSTGLTLERASTLAVDHDDNVFVSDSSAEIVWVIASGKGTLPIVPGAKGNPAKGKVYAVAGNGTDNTPQSSSGISTPPAVSPGCTNPMDAAGDGCLATQAYLGLPSYSLDTTTESGNITVDANGNLYIADSTGYQANLPAPLGIRVVYASGAVAGLPSSVHPVPGHIYQISADQTDSVATDSHGNLYYNTQNSLNVIYGGTGAIPGIPAGSASGTYTIAGGNNATCAYDATPNSCANGGGAATNVMLPYQSLFTVAIGPSDNIYIADGQDDVVRAIYVGGNLPGITGSTVGYIYNVVGNGSSGPEVPGAQALQSPIQGTALSTNNGVLGPLVFDAAGNMYIGQVGYNTDKVDPSGKLTIVFNGGGIVNPLGMGFITPGVSSCVQATDPLGDGCPANQVYVYDAGTFNGMVAGFATLNPGFAVDSAGNMYYTDNENPNLGNTFYGIVHKIDATNGQIDASGNVGSVIPAQPLEIYNSGDQPLAFADLVVSGNYSLEPTGGKTDCAASTNLLPGASCQIDVVFNPTSVGANAGSVTIASNAVNAASVGANVETLDGTGLPGLTDTVLAIAPSAPSVANAGQQVVFSATVGPPNGAAASTTPTGSVTFTDQNGNTYGPANVTQANGSKSGVASYATTSLAAGAYTIAAAYSGDGNFAASSSAPQPLTIAASGTPAPAIALTASASSATAGRPITLTATLTAPGSGTAPTGTVTFEDSYQAGANILGAGTLSGGVATLSVSTLPIGTNIIVAYYAGDSRYAGNASAAVSVLVTNNATLQIVPGVIQTIAGSFGRQGYAGDGGAASAALLNIGGFAADASGNLYIADSIDNVVRKIAAGSGTISTIAGGGSGGDGGPATAAQLNGPGLVFADAFGDIYIAEGPVTPQIGGLPGGPVYTDIRRVDGKTGVIATLAGQSGTLGYTGDGGLATAAQIGVNGIFVDNSGNLYFADAIDLVARRIDARTGIVNTIAGNGEACVKSPCGDGGPALSAQFGAATSPAYQPVSGLTGVAVDPAGNVYLSDESSGLIRKVDAATAVISTIAGQYIPPTSFGGAFNVSPAGDGGPAADAVVGPAKLSGFDGAGNLYLSSLGLVREINVATQIINSVAGTQPTNGSNGPVLCKTAGQCGDGNIATAAKLGGYVAVDGQSNLYVGDYANSVVREVSSSASTLDYGNVVLDSPAAQPFTLTNNGSTPLTVQQLLTEGDFVQQFGAGGANAPADCQPNTSLAFGASCLANIAFTPIQPGAATGSLTIDNDASNAINGANTVALAGNGQGLGGTAPQTISFGPLANVQYGASVALSATASSSLPVSFLVNGPATLVTTSQGSFLKTTGAGKVTVTAYQVGNQTTYKAATPVTQSLTVTPAPLTITAGPLSALQGAAIPDLSKDYAVVGLLNGDTVSGVPALSTTATSSSPCGTYPIGVALGSLLIPSGYTPNFVNGTLYITGAQPQTIAFSQSLNSVAYGAAPIPLAASASSGLPVSFSATGATAISAGNLTIQNAGAATVTANQYGNCAYQAATPVTQSFNVNPAALTVTADNQTVALGTPLPTLSYTIAGYVNNDSPTVVSGSPLLSTTATAGSPSGTYPITVARGTLAAVNYSFTLVPGTLTINPGIPQTIAFGSLSNTTYGAAPITLGAMASSGLPVTYAVSSGSGSQAATVVGNQLTIVGAGMVTVTASQSGGGTYAPAAPVSQSFTINPAVLTVTANPASRTDYTQNPAFSATIAGFVNGDPPAVVSGTPSFTTSATPSSAPGDYPIVPAQGTLAALNYSFTFVNGDLTVTTGGPAQDYTFTATPQALSVLSGQVGQTTLTVSPVNYYQNTVAFSCGSLPANVSCVFSPSATASTDGIDPAGVTLTIDTGPATVSRVSGKATIFSAAVLPAGALLAWLLARRRRQNAFFKFQILIAGLLSSLALAYLVACGSSGGSSHLSGGAAAGTFTVTVSASGAANGPSHSVPVSVTVR